jgi:pimeloyl-ACP methyl ester carboxylesterase
MEELAAPGHVRPDERGIVFVGHSMGGLVASNLAVRAASGELPPPLALMVVTPGKTWPGSSPFAFHLEDLSRLPSSLLLLAVIGDDDDFVGEVDARKVYKGATAVPLSNKDYVRLFSDDYGAPALVADHRAPAAPLQLVEENARVPRGEAPVTNALDYFGTWKLFDGLADAVFRGVHREYALGGTREQRSMGHWSDRTPVRELMIEEP